MEQTTEQTNKRKSKFPEISNSPSKSFKEDTNIDINSKLINLSNDNFSNNSTDNDISSNNVNCNPRSSTNININNDSNLTINLQYNNVSADDNIIISLDNFAPKTKQSSVHQISDPRNINQITWC